MKTKTITLAAFDAFPDTTVGQPPYNTVPKWRVLKVTDSIEFKPGDSLVKDQVEAMVADAGWRVTVVPMPGSK